MLNPQLYQCSICRDFFAVEHFTVRTGEDGEEFAGPCNDCVLLSRDSQLETHLRMHNRPEWCPTCVKAEL